MLDYGIYYKLINESATNNYMDKHIISEIVNNRFMATGKLPTAERIELDMCYYKNITNKDVLDINELILAKLSKGFIYKNGDLPSIELLTKLFNMVMSSINNPSNNWLYSASELISYFYIKTGCICRKKNLKYLYGFITKYNNVGYFSGFHYALTKILISYYTKYMKMPEIEEFEKYISIFKINMEDNRREEYLAGANIFFSCFISDELQNIKFNLIKLKNASRSLCWETYLLLSNYILAYNFNMLK